MDISASKFGRCLSFGIFTATIALIFTLVRDKSIALWTAFSVSALWAIGASFSEEIRNFAKRNSVALHYGLFGLLGLLITVTGCLGFSLLVAQAGIWESLLALALTILSIAGVFGAFYGIYRLVDKLNSTNIAQSTYDKMPQLPAFIRSLPHLFVRACLMMTFVTATACAIMFVLVAVTGVFGAEYPGKLISVTPDGVVVALLLATAILTVCLSRHLPKDFFGISANPVLASVISKVIVFDAVAAILLFPLLASV